MTVSGQEQAHRQLVKSCSPVTSCCAACLQAATVTVQQLKACVQLTGLIITDLERTILTKDAYFIIKTFMPFF